MSNWLWQLLSEDDDKAPCFAKVVTLGSLVLFQVMAVYGLLTQHEMHLNEYANGVAVILGAGGALIGLKQATSKSQPT